MLTPHGAHHLANSKGTSSTRGRVRWLPGKLAGEIDGIQFHAYYCEKWSYIRLLLATTVIGAVIFGSIVRRSFGAGKRPDLLGNAER